MPGFASTDGDGVCERVARLVLSHGLMIDLSVPAVVRRFLAPTVSHKDNSMSAREHSAYAAPSTIIGIKTKYSMCNV